MKIGIAGVGGIGSNVALHLVRTKIKCLKIVDSDRVINRNFWQKDYKKIKLTLSFKLWAVLFVCWPVRYFYQTVWEV